MVEEHGVHGLAHIIITAEREREVADAATHLGAGQMALYPTCGAYEVDAIGGMLFHTGAYGEHIGVENDVFGRKLHSLGEQSVGALAHGYLALVGGGLSGFIKCHHHHCGAHLLDILCFSQKVGFARLQADAVHYAFALHILQCGGHHLPVAAVYHHRHACHIGLGGKKSQKMAHLLAGIYETFIHIHIHYLRTVFHLRAGYCHGFVVLFRRYKSQKFLTSCHIASLAHVHKVEFGGDAQRLQAGEGHHGLYHGHLARRVVLCHLSYGGYMRGRSAAATAYHVHQSCLEHGLHMRHHSGGCLIIFAHLVGQSGIGIHAHCHRRYGRKFFHPTAHTFGAKSAIQTNHQRSGMLHARQGCRHGLSAEHSTALGERERYGTLYNALIFCLILLLGCKHGF